jgi:hypothetical protein
MLRLPFRLPLLAAEPFVLPDDAGEFLLVNRQNGPIIVLTG